MAFGKRPLITQKKKLVINDAATGKFAGQAPLTGGWINSDMPGMTKLASPKVTIAATHGSADSGLTDNTPAVVKKLSTFGAKPAGVSNNPKYAAQDAAAAAKGKRPFIPFKKKGM